MTHHEHDRDILMDITEGMDVYDSDGDKIGTVERVYFGSEDREEPGPESTTAPDPATRGKTFVDVVADIFDPQDIPEEVRERLLRRGFLHIDGGVIFDSDYFVLPNEIEGVTEEGVRLRVKEEELFSA